MKSLITLIFLSLSFTTYAEESLFGVGNSSVRCRVSLDDNTCIPGFKLYPGARYLTLVGVIGRTTLRDKVEDALRDPKLTLYNKTKDEVVVANDDWCNVQFIDQELYESIFQAVWTFFDINLTENCDPANIFADPNNDAIVLRWLEPGEYTVNTTMDANKDGSGGVVLSLFQIIEIEELEAEPL